MNPQYAFIAPLLVWFTILFVTILIDVTSKKMRDPKGKPFAMTIGLVPFLTLLLIACLAGSAYIYYN